jgi:hypothetical protein
MNGGQQPAPPNGQGGQGGQQPKNEPKNQPPANGKPSSNGHATQGVNGRRAAADAAIAEHSKEAAKAKIAFMKGR